MIFIDFMDFHGFHGFQGMGCLDGMRGPATRLETFAPFQAGFLSSEDFHPIRDSIFFMDFR